jgi:hypothetical protein
MNKLTFENLARVVSYDAKTGAFTRNKNGQKIGKINKDGYVEISVYSKRYLVHRLAWFYVYGVWPEGSLDHVDRDKTNNAIDNLRKLTPSQQAQNTNLHPLNTSGYRGVFLDKQTNRWRARIRVNNVKHSLGAFDTAEEAYAAYLLAAKKYHTHNPLVNL